MASIVLFYVTILALVAFGVFVVVERVALPWRVLAMRRRVSAPAPASLVAGPAKLAGTLETGGPGAPAVTVRIRQAGSKGSEPGVSTTAWKEQERRVDARPFTLVLAGTGARVEVDPGDDPRLLARSDVTTEGSERTVVASVAHGERVVVEGALTPARGEAEGYREPPRTLALRAPDGGRVIVEAESSAREPDGTAARRRSISGFLLLLVVPVVCAVAWHVGERSRSETVTAAVTSVQFCGYMYKGTQEYDPCFTAASQSPGGASIEFPNVPQLDTPLRVGDRTDVTFVRGHPGTFTVGRALEPGSIEVVVYVMGLLVLGLFGYILVSDWRIRRRWYDTEPFDWEEPT